MSLFVPGSVGFHEARPHPDALGRAAAAVDHEELVVHEAEPEVHGIESVVDERDARARQRRESGRRRVVVLAHHAHLHAAVLGRDERVRERRARRAAQAVHGRRPPRRFALLIRFTRIGVKSTLPLAGWYVASDVFCSC